MPEGYAQRLCAAIRIAEGDVRYGVRSIRTTSVDQARRICLNSISNSWVRWENAGRPCGHLEFFALRWTPPSVDPVGHTNLIRNLRYIMHEQHLKTILREVASKEHHALLICASQSHLDATRRQLEALAIPMDVDQRSRNLTARIRTIDGKVSTLEMMVLPNDRSRATFALTGRNPSQVFTDEMMEMSLAQYAAIMDRFPLDNRAPTPTKGGDMHK